MLGLCTGAKLNLGDRVLAEGEMNSFIASPGKGRYSAFLPSENFVSQPQEDLTRSFIATVQGWGCC